MLTPPDTILLALLALMIEALVGYPDALYRALGHPVTWMGALIGRLDRRLNREAEDEAARRRAGVLALAILLGTTATAVGALSLAAEAVGVAGFLILALLASSLMAQRSLHDHVAAVARGLDEQGLPGGRQAVSMIVGRDPESLDAAAVSRAAIESLAENFSDGIVAPALWTAAGGLTGGALYKAANTADSMIGHRTPQHAAFGWAAARFDDLVNWPAARLSALLIVAAAALHPGASSREAWRAMRRDARHHRSPNAGWPEAAMAGALGLRLAGPRVYGAVRVEDGWMGDGRAEATSADIARALALYRTACGLLWALLALTWLALAPTPGGTGLG
jgi:adenosylcobinamide-phosphate synthase